MSVFIFSSQCAAQTIYQAEVPKGINSKAALLDALSAALRFPDYFGRNWDALGECIRDLSWLPPGDVVLIHNDLPLAKDRASLSIYLSILKDAIESWNTMGSNLIYVSPEKWDTTGKRELLLKRKFSVMFPPDTQSAVERLLAGVQDAADSSRDNLP